MERKFNSMRITPRKSNSLQIVDKSDTYSIAEHVSFMRYYVKRNRVYFFNNISAGDFDFLNCHLLLNNECELPMDYPNNVFQFVFLDNSPLKTQQKQPEKSFHSFVLQMLDGNFLYACCVIVYDQVFLKNNESLDYKNEDEQMYFLPRALCFTSRFPIYQSMQRILSEFCESSHDSFGETDLRKLSQQMKTIHHSFDMKPSRSLRQRFSPEIDFAVLFRHIPPNMITNLFSLLVCENSLAIISSDVSILTPIMEALLCLIHPLKWTFTFLPILPEAFIDILGAPQPVFVGIPNFDSSKLQVINDDQNISVYNIDSGKLRLSQQTACQIPIEVKTRLIEHTMSILSSGDQLVTVAKIGALRWEFLKALCTMFCEYEELIQARQTALMQSRGSFKGTEGNDRFLKKSPPYFHEFLQHMLRTQHFQHFIEDRSTFDRFRLQEDLFRGLTQDIRKKRKTQLEILTAKDIKGMVWKLGAFGSWKLQTIEFKKTTCTQETDSGFCKCSISEQNSFKFSQSLAIRIPSALSKPPAKPFKTQFPLLFEEKKVGIRRKHLFCCLSEDDRRMWADAGYARLYVSLGSLS